MWSAVVWNQSACSSELGDNIQNRDRSTVFEVCPIQARTALPRTLDYSMRTDAAHARGSSADGAVAPVGGGHVAAVGTHGRRVPPDDPAPHAQEGVGAARVGCDDAAGVCSAGRRRRPAGELGRAASRDGADGQRRGSEPHAAAGRVSVRGGRAMPRRRRAAPSARRWPGPARSDAGSPWALGARMCAPILSTSHSP